jgi:uncharacterized protein YgiM (DUF1202 family)
MKKTTVLILCLVFFSLACLEISAAIAAVPTIRAAGTIPPTRLTLSVPTSTKIVISAAAPRTCARVIAIEALHVRAGASETGRILTWLKNNDIVVVVDQSNANWWRIESPVMNGYVRSIYLQEVECE